MPEYAHAQPSIDHDYDHDFWEGRQRVWNY